jgi:N-acetylmuramoyl-L-alanine amidase
LKKYKKIIGMTILFLIMITILSENRSFITTSTTALDIGSTGSKVEEMQQKLKNWGFYDGGVNGNYGWSTHQAVKSFQLAHGLSATGAAGEETLYAMGMTQLAETGLAYAQGQGIPEEQLLARAINGEARGEPYEGQVAVGAVILNRTKDSRFPKTIAGVIYQPGAFTAVSDGQINVAMEAGSTVVKAARDAMNGWDPTNGAVYYWNPATATSTWIWSRQIVKKIGKHYFGK